MAIQRTDQISEAAFAVRIIVTVGIAIGLAQLISSEALGADAPGVSDFTFAQPEAIEASDIVAALSVARGSRIEVGAPPTVRLPILFEFNSANLRPEGRDLLEKLGIALADRDLDNFRFAVNGHTDSVGSKHYNRGLSQRRADSVKIFLTRRGLADERFDSVGLGEVEPVAPNDNSQGRQRNRRVEIINLGSNS